MDRNTWIVIVCCVAFIFASWFATRRAWMLFGIWMALLVLYALAGQRLTES